MVSSRRSPILAALAAAVLAGSAASQPATPAPPGLSATSWKILSVAPESAIFFNPGHLARGRGWFTIVLANPRSYGGVATNVSYMQAFQIADCPAGTMTNTVLAFYDGDGRPLRALPVPDAKANPVRPGTFGATELNLLCGRPAKLYADAPLSTRGTELLGVYAAMLDIQADDTRRAAAPQTTARRPAVGGNLINGEPLQYNREYICNGERVAIARCYNDQDDAGCQVDYPDRPLRNGLMVQTIEDRGDVIRKLQACVAPERAQAKPPSAGGGAYGGGLQTPPGVGPASWKTIFLNPQSAGFVAPAAIRRSGGVGQGWFTDIWAQPRDIGALKGVGVSQWLMAGDCTKNTLRLLRAAHYDPNRRPLIVVDSTDTEAKTVQPGSIGDLRLGLLCGRPVKLVSDEPLTMDVAGLQDVYATQRTFAALPRSDVAAPPRPASTARPPAPAAAPASAGRVRPPGLGAAPWRVLYLNPRSASFFTPATIRRSGDRATGWFTDIYAQPQSPSNAIRDISIDQSLWEADCTAGTMRLAYVAYYRADGSPILQNPTDGLTPQPQRPGTNGGAKLDVLCGRKVELYSNETMSMEVLQLKDAYATQLVFARTGPPPGQGAPASARPPAPASSPAAQIPAPGMRVATWKFLTVVTDRAFLFAPSQLRRSAGGGQGWLMEAYRKPATMPDVKLRNVGIDQYLYSADCARNVLTNSARIFYAPSGAQLAALDGLGTVRPQPGSPVAEFMNVLCGRPQELWDKDAYTYSATDVRAYYNQLMDAHDAVEGR